MSNKKLIMEHRYDFDANRHYINGINIAFHCHHFTALTTRLAMDAKDLNNGPRILAEASEDSFRQVLSGIFALHSAETLDEKISLAEQYFSWCGLGVIRFDAVSIYGGEVTVSSSHVDDAWVNKWGKSERPVNYIGKGFISAVFSLAYEVSSRRYRVSEAQSIACGDKASVFSVIQR
jgi:hypothetical protein